MCIYVYCICAYMYIYIERGIFLPHCYYIIRRSFEDTDSMLSHLIYKKFSLLVGGL